MFGLGSGAALTEATCRRINRRCRSGALAFGPLGFPRVRQTLLLGIAAAALTAGGCGSDGTSTKSQAASTSRPALAASTTDAHAASTKIDSCPVDAAELTKVIGVPVQAGPPPSSNHKSACGFVPTTPCPCGPHTFGELEVTILWNVARSLRAQRTYYASHPADEIVQSNVVDRPDLGPDAFELSGSQARGATVFFPASGGVVSVLVALGFGKADAQDKQISQTIIALVHQRFT
jgi:hypothetical protein